MTSVPPLSAVISKVPSRKELLSVTWPAGLVYSVCQNYLNRVKGNRAVGRRVFIQGGVCYNKAVPLAMAGLLGKEIVVPPEPGLMGAFGVALEVKNRLEMGLLESMEFNLEELAMLELQYLEPFTCHGGKEQCDRKCTISRFLIGEKIYPFGGSCNRYVNLIRGKESFLQIPWILSGRGKILTEKYTAKKRGFICPTKNSCHQLFANDAYAVPLYYGFNAWAFRCSSAKELDQQGMKRRGLNFAIGGARHGTLQDCSKPAPAYISCRSSKLCRKKFAQASVSCPMVQSEQFYLQAAFHELSGRVLSPVLDFSQGYASPLPAFYQDGRHAWGKKPGAEEAFLKALPARKHYKAV